MKTLILNVTGLDGQTRAIEAIEGWQVMEILRDYGFPIKAECGGACCCATCHVYVAPEWADRVQPMGDEEEVMLDSALEVRESSRLSCQIVMTEALDGLCVTIAPNPE